MATVLPVLQWLKFGAPTALYIGLPILHGSLIVAQAFLMPVLYIRGSEDAQALFVEVKGPGDSLRDGQLAWIDVLVRAGAAVQVAYVQSVGDL